MKAALVLVGVAAAVAVSGCGGTKRALGLERAAPDEFRVITKAPLVMPPDYALRPPRPGEARPADNTAAPTPAVFGETTGAQASDGEKLLIAKAGATSVDGTISSTVDFEGAAVIRKPAAYADKLLAPTVAPTSTDEQEATRRATGGGTVTIEPGKGKGNAQPAKLPGL